MTRFVLICIVFILAGCAPERLRPTELPAAVVSVPGATVDELQRASKLALKQRGWTRLAETDHSVTGKIDRNMDGWIVVEISCSAGQASIVTKEARGYRIGDSRSGYTARPNGSEAWVANLAKDIPRLTESVQIYDSRK